MVCDQVDRAHVPAAASQSATEAVVEVVDVAAGKATVASDLVANLECHLVHEAEHAATRGPGDPDVVWLKPPERVRREGLGAEFGLDGRDEIRAGRPEICAPDARPKDREQCAGMGEQETLATIDPQQVQVPLVVLGGNSPSATDRPPSRSSIFLVQRTTISGNLLPVPAFNWRHA